MGESQGEIGLVAQGAHLFVPGAHPAQRVEQGEAFRLLAATHQGDAQVVPSIGARPLAAAPFAQGLNGLLVTPLGHAHVGREQAALGVHGRRQPFILHPCEGGPGLVQVAPLIPDLGQVETRAVAHVCIVMLVQQARKDIAGLFVKAIGQIQTAQEQARIVLMMTEKVLLTGRFEAGDGSKVVALVEMKQGLAIGQVPHHARFFPNRAMGGQNHEQHGQEKPSWTKKASAERDAHQSDTSSSPIP